MADPTSPHPTPAGLEAPPRLATVREAANYCGVSTTSIRRWIASGRLEAYRVGPKNIRVELDSVRSMVVPA